MDLSQREGPKPRFEVSFGPASAFAWQYRCRRGRKRREELAAPATALRPAANQRFCAASSSAFFFSSCSCFEPGSGFAAGAGGWAAGGAAAALAAATLAAWALASSALAALTRAAWSLAAFAFAASARAASALAASALAALALAVSAFAASALAALWHPGDQSVLRQSFVIYKARSCLIRRRRRPGRTTGRGGHRPVRAGRWPWPRKSAPRQRRRRSGRAAP